MQFSFHVHKYPFIFIAFLLFYRYKDLFVCHNPSLFFFILGIYWLVLLQQSVCLVKYPFFSLAVYFGIGYVFCVSISCSCLDDNICI